MLITKEKSIVENRKVGGGGKYRYREVYNHGPLFSHMSNTALI